MVMLCGSGTLALNEYQRAHAQGKTLYIRTEFCVPYCCRTIIKDIRRLVTRLERIRCYSPPGPVNGSSSIVESQESDEGTEPHRMEGPHLEREVENKERVQ